MGVKFTKIAPVPSPVTENESAAKPMVEKFD